MFADPCLPPADKVFERGDARATHPMPAPGPLLQLIITLLKCCCVHIRQNQCDAQVKFEIFNALQNMAGCTKILDWRNHFLIFFFLRSFITIFYETDINIKIRNPMLQQYKISYRGFDVRG